MATTSRFGILARQPGTKVIGWVKQPPTNKPATWLTREDAQAALNAGKYTANMGDGWTFSVREQTPTADYDTDVRPDFRGFAEQLRAEAKWSSLIHENDNTGQAATDQRRLLDLADTVEQVGKLLGFM